MQHLSYKEGDGTSEEGDADWHASSTIFSCLVFFFYLFSIYPVMSHVGIVLVFALSSIEEIFMFNPCILSCNCSFPFPGLSYWWAMILIVLYNFIE